MSAPAPPRCPICRRPAQPAFRPFCSRRCRTVDLSRWLGGVYRIPDGEASGQPDGHGESGADEF
ncbi:MAG: DNA gyrase inhibitor YacG [Rhodospirillaceae bacterium]